MAMMKIKCLIFGLAVGAAILTGCNDDLNPVGPSIQPGEDEIAVFADTFTMEASTMLMDAIYAKTDTGLLGELYDPLYGNLKADYICQLYCPEGYKFSHTPIDGKIDSVDFRIFYHSWVGDSLAPMRAQLYLVTKQLDKNYYTNINPANYCDMQTTLGAQTYTAVDMTVPDSVRYEKGSDGNYVFYPDVTIEMPKELGQKFYDETVNSPSTFASQDAFNQFFPGLYVTNTFGTGNILSVDNSYLTIYYKYNVIGSRGQDSVVKTAELFNTTKEVIQLNRFSNGDLDKLVQPSDDYTYLKTPAGVCTRLVIPSKQMKSILEGRVLNNLPLNLTAMPQEDWKYALKAPTYLLAIPEDSVKTFFESGSIEDYKTSFLGGYSSSALTYTFGNISNVLKNQLEKDPDKDLTLLIVPIIRTTTRDYYGNTYTSGIYNYMSPGGVKLRKDPEKMQIIVTSSKYNR